MNEFIKMNNVRIAVSFFATSIIIKFLEAPLKGVKLDTKTANVYAEMNYDFSKLPSSIFADCASARHGLKQKLVDSLAMNADVKALTSVKEATDSLNSLWNQLLEGDWNAKSKVKGETVKLSALEEQFLAGVKTGTVPFDQAAALYKSITGKDLPKPVTEEDEAEAENEESTDENAEE